MTLSSCGTGRSERPTIAERLPQGSMRDPKTVSAVMARIRKTNTGPELLLRQALRAFGVTGYRLYRPVPGRPDLSFGKERVAVFVDGCFWHQCPSCHIPVPRTSYWQKKIARNVERDQETDLALSALGWTVIRFWEHDVRRNAGSAAQCVKRLLRRRRAPRPCHRADSPSPPRTTTARA